jgi:hypothetical protein
MQILAIVLYSKSGKQRRLEFKPGQVNIITGRSKTGKSALINIVDYCLGSSQCDIASGPIRNTVAWYGLYLQFANSRVFIARENPSIGAQTTNTAYIAESANLEIPEAIPPRGNTTSEAIVKNLSAKLSISPNLNIPGEGQTREPVSADMRHALFYCFQEQDEITSRKNLIHRQNESWMTNTIKDTLPYFLGAIREDSLALEQELRKAKRDLRLLQRQALEDEQIRGIGISRALRLLGEARQLGLIPADFNESLDDLTRISQVLTNVLEWKPGQHEYKGENLLPRLLNERFELELQRNRLLEDIEAANSYAHDQEGYVSAAEQQVVRLESIHFYKDVDHNSIECPICGQAVSEPIPNIQAIQTHIDDLQNELVSIDRDRPQFQSYVSKKEEELKKCNDARIQLEQQIQGYYQQQVELSRLRDADIARGRVVGRISLWLESVKDDENPAELKIALGNAQKEVNRLENLIDSDGKLKRITEILLSLSIQMTQWANQLNLEHSGESTSVRLDWGRMSLKVTTPNEDLSLRQIGSGENWLYYHLIAHFALHQHFTQNGRPVPRFIFLDQPTQVYFPEEQSGKKSQRTFSFQESGRLEETDRQAVEKLFKFIFDFAKSLAPNFQIIISDHANLENDEFGQAICERWRDGLALIPTSWIDEFPAPVIEVKTDGAASVSDQPM